MKLVDMEHILEADAITHAGIFHADEVLATAILCRIYSDLTVCRANQVPSFTPAHSIIYDIGGKAFDHHQKGGNGSRKNGIPYASAGLIWREFGMHVVESSSKPEKAWRIVDERLVQGVDAVDNGLMRNAESVAQMTFSDIIRLMNPHSFECTDAVDDAFCEAVRFAGSVLERVLETVESELLCEPLVSKAIQDSVNHVLDLPAHMPWERTLLESTDVKANNIFFVVFPSARGGYNWQCVPTKTDARSKRFEVPETWWGLNGSQLCEVTGVSDAVFCHQNGFLGAAASHEGAIEMLRIALREID